MFANHRYRMSLGMNYEEPRQWRNEPPLPVNVSVCRPVASAAWLWRYKIFPTCVEYFDSSRCDQLLLEPRRELLEPSRHCRLLAATERFGGAATSHVLSEQLWRMSSRRWQQYHWFEISNSALIWVVRGNSFLFFHLFVSFSSFNPLPMFFPSHSVPPFLCFFNTEK